VLDWLDEQTESIPEASAFLTDARAYYYGQLFTPDDVQQSMSFLYGQGLITGVTVEESDNVYHAQITDDGRACIEQYGSVADWMNRGTLSGGDTITTTITNSPGAQWMNESPAAQQAAVTTLTTDARTQVLKIADQILASLEAVDLPTEQRQEAKAAAAELRELAADPAADKGRVRSALGVIATSTLGAIGTEAGRRVLALVQQAVEVIVG
jgi:hypothetical protein